jgi:hypothetical protein
MESVRPCACETGAGEVYCDEAGMENGAGVDGGAGVDFGPGVDVGPGVEDGCRGGGTADRLKVIIFQPGRVGCGLDEIGIQYCMMWLVVGVGVALNPLEESNTLVERVWCYVMMS